MHCEQAEMLLAELVFGELEEGDERLAAVESHVEGCAHCRERLGDMRETVGLLGEGIEGMGEMKLSGERRARLMELLDNEVRVEEEVRGPFVLMERVRAIAAVAAVVMLMVGLGGMMNLGSSSAGPEYAGDYERDGLKGRDWVDEDKGEGWVARGNGVDVGDGSGRRWYGEQGRYFSYATGTLGARENETARTKDNDAGLGVFGGDDWDTGGARSYSLSQRRSWEKEGHKALETRRAFLFDRSLSGGEWGLDKDVSGWAYRSAEAEKKGLGYMSGGHSVPGDDSKGRGDLELGFGEVGKVDEINGIAGRGDFHANRFGKDHADRRVDPLVKSSFDPDRSKLSLNIVDGTSPMITAGGFVFGEGRGKPLSLFGDADVDKGRNQFPRYRGPRTNEVKGFERSEHGEASVLSTLAGQNAGGKSSERYDRILSLADGRGKNVADEKEAWKIGGEGTGRGQGQAQGKGHGLGQAAKGGKQEDRSRKNALDGSIKLDKAKKSDVGGAGGGRLGPYEGKLRDGDEEDQKDGQGGGEYEQDGKSGGGVLAKGTPKPKPVVKLPQAKQPPVVNAPKKSELEKPGQSLAKSFSRSNPTDSVTPRRVTVKPSKGKESVGGGRFAENKTRTDVLPNEAPPSNRMVDRVKKDASKVKSMGKAQSSGAVPKLNDVPLVGRISNQTRGDGKHSNDRKPGEYGNLTDEANDQGVGQKRGDELLKMDEKVWQSVEVDKGALKAEAELRVAELLAATQPKNWKSTGVGVGTVADHQQLSQALMKKVAEAMAKQEAQEKLLNDGSEVNRLLRAARDKFKGEKYGDALREVDRTLSLDPENVAANAMKAMIQERIVYHHLRQLRGDRNLTTPMVRVHSIERSIPYSELIQYPPDWLANQKGQKAGNVAGVTEKPINGQVFELSDLLDKGTAARVKATGDIEEEGRVRLTAELVQWTDHNLNRDWARKGNEKDVKKVVVTAKGDQLLVEGDEVAQKKAAWLLGGLRAGKSMGELSRMLQGRGPVVAAKLDDEVKDDGELPKSAMFKTVAVNPWVLSARDRLSTFAMDVDTASYALARRYIRRGFLPPVGSVRMEEFVNAFEYNYPASAERLFNIHVEGGEAPFGDGVGLVKVGVKAKVIGRDQRKPAHLVCVLDASGSMDRPDRLGLAKYAIGQLADNLADADRLTLITYGTRARLLAEAAQARQGRERLVGLIDGVQSGGSTNMLDAMRLAYGKAREHYKAGYINRVILCSDGVANIGPTGAKAMLEAVDAHRKQGITLTTVGFGLGAYNDNVMEELANKGDGTYAFVDSKGEAKRIFVDDMTATLQTVAKDAKIQVAFDPSVVRRYRLVGYENRVVADKDFRNDKIDAGEVGSGQSATALYEVELTEGGFGGRAAGARDLGTVFVRYKNVETDKVEEISAKIGGNVVRSRRAGDSARFYLAACAAEFAEVLRGSEHAKGGDLDGIIRQLEVVRKRLPLDKRVAELLDLVKKAKGLPRAP